MRNLNLPLAPLNISQNWRDIHFIIEHDGREADDTRKLLKPLKKKYPNLHMKFWCPASYRYNHTTNTSGISYPEFRIKFWVHAEGFDMEELLNDTLDLLEGNGIQEFKIWEQSSNTVKR